MKRDIWYFVFALGVMLFTWPILSIFKDRMPAYLFISWLVFIILIYITSRSSEGDDSGG